MPVNRYGNYQSRLKDSKEARVKRINKYMRDSKGRFMSTSTPPTPPPKPQAPVFRKASTFMKEYSAYKPRLVLNAYPGCCGAGVLVGFSSIPRTADDALMKTYLDIELKAADKYARSCRWGLLSCIVTKAQHSANPLIHEALINDGWVVAVKSGNPNHRNQTTLFFYQKIIGGGDTGVVDNDSVAQAVKELPRSSAQAVHQYAYI